MRAKPVLRELAVRLNVGILSQRAIAPARDAAHAEHSGARRAGRTEHRFITYAKAHPGKLNYGTGGAGTTPHFSTEALASAAKVDVTHVPFKGAGEATLALLSGTIDFQIASTPGVMGQVKGGKVRLLGISGDKRLTALPEVPTFAEAGIKNYGVINFTGLWAPKKTPAPVMQRLQKEIATAMASPDVQKFSADLGSVPSVGSGDALAKMLRENTELWGKVAGWGAHCYAESGIAVAVLLYFPSVSPPGTRVRVEEGRPHEL